MLTIVANLKKAARDHQIVTIGGGQFNPVELAEAARVIEGADELLQDIKCFVLDHDNKLGPHIDRLRAAIAKIDSEAGPVHPGGMDATQSIAWFKEHGIEPEVIYNGKTTKIVEYKCMSRYLTGHVQMHTHRIRVPHGVTA
jgi:hypothetical protein